jgi:hypothetical protein
MFQLAASWWVFFSPLRGMRELEQLRELVPAGVAARDHDEHGKENSSRQLLPS